MKTFCADFETTVYEGQTSTEVWSSAVVELHTEKVMIFTDIETTLIYLSSFKENVIVYYHNLKFDGSFWIHYLMTKTDYTADYTEIDENNVEWNNKFKMPKRSFQYTISNMGQWYTIRIRTDNNTIEIRDSLKLLPFKLEKIGNSFKTKHRKLEMEYEGMRYSGCTITPEERAYIENDVLLLKEAIEIMEEQNHLKLTIGSCCLSEFKSMYGQDDYALFFPDLTEIECPIEGFKNADAYIRKTYRGGWCYLDESKANTILTDGITLDVNSLYPSMMHSMSGNRYPIGKPTFWTGSLPKEATLPNRYFFIHIRTRFWIKKGHLPTVQIKGSLVYKGNEWLATSDVKGKDGKYFKQYILFGEKHDTRVDLFLTQTDYKLFHEQYDVYDYEELDGCWFYTELGIFDEYINKYKEIKMNSKGAIRELAKLFLNNLYGKMGANDCSSFKIAYLRDDNSLGYKTIEQYDKKCGYIPCGSAITSYARNFTIRTAQANYHPNGRGFTYADTDSIHCDCPIEQIVNAPQHPTEFCHWKHESSWDRAIFVRQKTYIEHIVEEDGEPIDKTYNNIKCAGMGERCKQLLNKSLGEDVDLKKVTPEEEIFINEHRTLEDFKIGLKVPSKLLPKNIDGGVLLCKTTFEMR